MYEDLAWKLRMEKEIIRTRTTRTYLSEMREIDALERNYCSDPRFPRSSAEAERVKNQIREDREKAERDFRHAMLFHDL